MKEISEMTGDDLLSEDTLDEVFDEQDIIKRSRLIIQLSRQAKKCKIKREFDMMVNAYKQMDREIKQQKAMQHPQTLINNYTNFGDEYQNLYCGAWIAGENGIFAQTSGGIEQVACYHPILPVERMKNIETGEEQIKLAYKRNRRWTEITVPKTLISSASRIVALSSQGVAVTSENAKLLVKYLSDVENGNDDYINVIYSTSKLGWNKSDFIPYDDSIAFDGDSRFKQIRESIDQRGSYDAWIKHVRQLRASGRMEVKFLLAASFASVLIKPLGGLPFFVDLWGETEGGKTVSLMVAASVWADPAESRFIGDFKTTDVALEAKADMLNNLPMFLDDTSKTSSRIRDNFEGVVYDLCSGKGKSRSNKDLGINRENHWCNAIICNGERPLCSYVSQGGAINRILEVECKDHVYADPRQMAETVKRHYGFAGREFVEILKKMSVDSIREIQKDFLDILADDEKMQKQSMSLSIVLTADKIVTDCIFKDGAYISIEDAKKILTDKDELSDNERCYRYLQDKITMNPQRFDIDTKCEKWGVLEDGYAIIYNSAFESLCREAGFSKKSFLSWADRKNLIQTQRGNLTKVKKINGAAARCVFLLMDETKAGDGFIELDGEQIDLPFR